MKAYAYAKLPDTNSVRLLQVLAGPTGSDLRCRIFTHKLREQRSFTPFEALSYAWGDQSERQHCIYIADPKASREAGNEGLVYITVSPTLHAALQQLRDPDLTRTIWIDAICINQEDLTERAAQVALMARVYSQATHVRVWIGEEADGSTVALNIIGSLADQKKFDIPHRQLNPRRVVQFAALLQRPWFRRLWVLQEVAAAHFITFVCGEVELAAIAFFEGLASAEMRRILHGHTELDEVLVSVRQLAEWVAFQPAHLIVPNRSSIPTLGISTIGELLDSFKFRKTSDQRDKIYALLGLSSDNDIHMLHPDYRKSWAHLFAEITAHVMGGRVLVKSRKSSGSEAIMIGIGFPLGVVASVRRDTMAMTYVSIAGTARNRASWSASFVLSAAHCGSVRSGDVLVQLEGNKKLTLLRHCHDHFDIVFVAIRPPSTITYRYQTEAGSHKEHQMSWWQFVFHWHYGSRTSKQLRTLIMVWDWHYIAGQRELNNSLVQHTHTAETAEETISDAADRQSARLSATIRILEDTNQHASIATIVNASPPATTTSLAGEHIRFMRIACKFWVSYIWFREELEELRWQLWASSAGLSGNGTNPETMSRYWSVESHLRLDLVDLLALDTALVLRARQSRNDSANNDVAELERSSKIDQAISSMRHSVHVPFLAATFGPDGMGSIPSSVVNDPDAWFWHLQARLRVLFGQRGPSVGFVEEYVL